MIKFKNLTIKNFQSVGNVTQEINLDENELILVLGENLDLGNNDYRNGTGKTVLTQAICYALYGSPITNIKKDNLINKINNKEMIVTLDFDINNINYRIERGRKPNILRFYVNSDLQEDPESEANGESQHTQHLIDSLIGISHKLYKQIISLSSRTQAFLSMKDGEQREIIEELLGITTLSKKAELLSVKLKETKDSIKEEEIRLKTIKESNEKIKNHIGELKLKSTTWDKNHKNNILKKQNDLDGLRQVDVDLELKNYSIILEISRLDKEVNQFSKDISFRANLLDSYSKKKENISSRLQDIKNSICPECNQKIDTHKTNDLIQSIEIEISENNDSISKIESEIFDLGNKLIEVQDQRAKLGNKPSVVYSNIDDIYNHQRLIDNVHQELENYKNQINPFDEQIFNLSDTALQDTSYEYLNELIALKDHQEFLLKLLTKKDSFIRKKIIDQNLFFLNTRLNHYLDTMNLPHEVTFNSDLSVDITKHGKNYDFDQLSTGEQNRLILSLSWAFRDIWETFNQSINLLIVDELVDTGMDIQGVTKALEILRQFVIERSKNILLISHKGDIENKVDNILFAEKQNDFTQYKFRDS